MTALSQARIGGDFNRITGLHLNLDVAGIQVAMAEVMHSVGERPIPSIADIVAGRSS